eukprot:5659113-Amphidinium_carterae.2
MQQDPLRAIPQTIKKFKLRQHISRPTHAKSPPSATGGMSSQMHSKDISSSAASSSSKNMARY